MAPLRGDRYLLRLEQSVEVPPYAQVQLQLSVQVGKPLETGTPKQVIFAVVLLAPRIDLSNHLLKAALEHQQHSSLSLIEA